MVKKTVFCNLDMDKKDLYIRQNYQFPLVGTLKEKLLAQVLALPKRRPPSLMVTLNSEMVVAAFKDPAFFGLIKRAELVVPDGMGVVWAREIGDVRGLMRRVWRGVVTAGRIAAGQFADRRLAGAELAEDIVSQAAKKGRTVYLLGGKPGVAQRALKQLQKKYRGLQGWANEGPADLDQATRSQVQTVVADLAAKKPDYLLVAFGMVRQEKFLADHRHQFFARLVIGVGGAIDFWADEVARAPRLVANRGGEWLYRLGRQPWRCRRQLRLLQFIWFVLTG